MKAESNRTPHYRYLPRSHQLDVDEGSNTTSLSHPLSGTIKTLYPSSILNTRSGSNLNDKNDSNQRQSSFQQENSLLVVNGPIDLLLTLICLFCLSCIIRCASKLIRNYCNQNNTALTNDHPRRQGDSTSNTNTFHPNVPIPSNYYASQYPSEYETNYPSNYEERQHNHDIESQRPGRLSLELFATGTSTTVRYDNSIFEEEEVLFDTPTSTRARSRQRRRRRRGRSGRETHYLDSRPAALAFADLREENRLKEEIIKELKICRYSELLEESEAIECCSICLNDYTSTDVVCQSHNDQCLHVFHKACIVEWLLLNHYDCPCCRHPYIPNTTINITPLTNRFPTRSIDTVNLTPRDLQRIRSLFYRNDNEDLQGSTSNNNTLTPHDLQRIRSLFYRNNNEDLQGSTSNNNTIVNTPPTVIVHLVPTTSNSNQHITIQNLPLTATPPSPTYTTANTNTIDYGETNIDLNSVLSINSSREYTQIEERVLEELDHDENASIIESYNNTADAIHDNNESTESLNHDPSTTIENNYANNDIALPDNRNNGLTTLDNGVMRGRYDSTDIHDNNESNESLDHDPSTTIENNNANNDIALPDNRNNGLTTLDNGVMRGRYDSTDIHDNNESNESLDHDPSTTIENNNANNDIALPDNRNNGLTTLDNGVMRDIIEERIMEVLVSNNHHPLNNNNDIHSIYNE